MDNNKEYYKPAVYYSYGNELIDLTDRILVSNYGNVKRPKDAIHGNATEEIPIYSTDSGFKGRYKYGSIRVYLNGTNKRFKIARLVASTFKPRDDAGKLTVDHIDGNIDNNHIDNLTWMTLADNIRKRKPNA